MRSQSCLLVTWALKSPVGPERDRFCMQIQPGSLESSQVCVWGEAREVQGRGWSSVGGGGPTFWLWLPFKVFRKVLPAASITCSHVSPGKVRS